MPRLGEENRFSDGLEQKVEENTHFMSKKMGYSKEDGCSSLSNKNSHCKQVIIALFCSIRRLI